LQAYIGQKQAYNEVLQPAFDALQAYIGQKQAYNEVLQPAFDALQTCKGIKQPTITPLQPYISELQADNGSKQYNNEAYWLRKAWSTFKAAIHSPCASVLRFDAEALVQAGQINA
jgi:hypothetical protein